MWQWMGLIAFDVAKEKAREAQEAADRWRLIDDGFEASAEEPRRRLPVRMAASALRRLSGASLSIGEAACEAATRLDHRTA